MRVRRRALSALAAAVVASLLACGGGVTERDQWTVWVTTDAPSPQLADRALVDVLDERGELACADCRRQLGVPTDPAGWPISFGVAVSDPGRPVRVRVRLYRAARAAADGLPAPATTFDEVAMLPPARGNTEVHMVLRAECIGVESDPAGGRTCSAPERVLVPERVLSPGKPDGALRPGQWPRAAAVPCAGAPPEMVCIPGGFFVLGDARDLSTSGTSPTIHSDERFVTLSPFAIDRDEVTVGVVRQLVAAGRVTSAPALRESGYADTRAQCTYLGPDDPANDQRPVSCVTFPVAEQVCAALGKRLPTEAEWEWVAGNLSAETRYPWGDVGDVCDLADVGIGRYATETVQPESYACRVRGSVAVKPSGLPAAPNPKDATALGVRGLAGGLSEWVVDFLAPYSAACWQPEQAFLVDPHCASAELVKRTLRGNAWSDSPGFVGSVGRQGTSPTSILPSVGFRCALSRGASSP